MKGEVIRVGHDRHEERLAFAVVERVLAATVEPYDICGRQRAVDALVHHPTGQTAALEVSSIGPEDESRIVNYLGTRGHSKRVAGVSRTWVIEVPRDFHPAEMRKIERVLPRCDASGAERLSELAGKHEDVDSLLTQGVRGHSVAGSTRQLVYFMLPVMGGFPGRGMASLADELAEYMCASKMQSKLKKLAATGLKERHLLLIVRPSAFSFPVYDGLAFGGPLPGGMPILPDGLTQVWLLTGIEAGGVVRGIAGQGWTRDHPYNKPHELAG